MFTFSVCFPEMKININDQCKEKKNMVSELSELIESVPKLKKLKLICLLLITGFYRRV